jgi:hypothetical protein
MTDEQWRKKMKDLTVRTVRSAGWILFVTGVIALTWIGIYEFAMDDEVSLPVKLATASVAAGLAGLFASVLRQRLIARKTDRYKDLEI